MPPPSGGPVDHSARQHRAPQVLDGLVADPDGVAELEHHGLVTRNGNFLHFSAEAERFLEALLVAIRQQAGC